MKLRCEQCESVKSARHVLAFLRTNCEIWRHHFVNLMFDLFQIWVFKTCKNEFDIVATKTGGHLKIDVFGSSFSDQCHEGCSRVEQQGVTTSSQEPLPSLHKNNMMHPTM